MRNRFECHECSQQRWSRPNRRLLRSDGQRQAKMVLAYEFDLGGYRLVSTLNGEVGGDTLAGKYETKTVDGSQRIDAGTFTTARK